MIEFEIDDHPYAIAESREWVADVDLLSWLAAVPIYPKVYWKDKTHTLSYAAAGSVLEFSHLPYLSPSSEGVRLYGGMRFSQERPIDPCWRMFPKIFFFLPKYEMAQQDGVTELRIRGEQKGDLPKDNLTRPLQNTTLSMHTRQDFPTKTQWIEHIHHLLHTMQHQKLRKLVLARKTTLQLSRPISPWTLLQHRCDHIPNVTTFAFELHPSHTFFGMTPETLFIRQGDRLELDALAGTRPRGKTLQEDLEYEQALVQSLKEQVEFSCVKNFLHTTLAPHAKTLYWTGKDRVMKQRSVQHLYNRLCATVDPNTHDATWLDLFHPTPAVGGDPKTTALRIQQQLEPFDRGWYAAPVGLLSAQGASFAVAIRSALLEDQHLHLFAGTGIVPGSDPQLEWEELNHKIAWLYQTCY